MDFRVRKFLRSPPKGDFDGASDTRASPAARSGASLPPEKAVREQLERLLASTHFRYSERLSRFLRFAVQEALAGNPDQLKESVLAIEIFDRQSTYDSRVDSVVRVEARRLREKLDKYYQAEGIDDPVLIELPKGTYVPAITIRPTAATVTPAQKAPAQFRMKTVAALLAAGVLATVFVTRWAATRGPSGTAALERLTSGPGLTFQPAMSADGRLVAYSSDRGGSGALDIWVQQVPRGTPVRLTENPADELEPVFSPDGTVIAFRQEGELGGIYTVPALGGRSLLLASGGYRPRFSPDGNWLAYWTGERTFRTAKVFVVPSTGGDPVRVAPAFAYAGFPIWSPDSRHVLFVGAREMLSGEPNTDDWDWWIAPLDGGPPVRASARRQLLQQGLRAPEAGWAHRWSLPYAWTPSGHILFSARSGDQTNIWTLAISARDWQVRGPARQLTFGAGRQDHPSIAADGSLVFTSLNAKSDIWSIPIDDKTGRASGPMLKLTSGPADSNRPSISRDGNRLAFVSNRTGSDQVWVRDLPSGRELALTATPEEKDAVVLSPDGSRIAFGYAPPLPQAILVLPFAGGKTSQLCSDCGLPRTWMPDGGALLYQRLAAQDSLIGLLRPSEGTAVLLRAAGSALFSPSVSADARWLALIVRNPPNEHRVMLVPLRDGRAEERAAWIPATEPGAWVDKPRWSATGHTVYYVSDRDGFVCIWAQEFDPAVRKLTGKPQNIVHFHSARVSLGAVFGLELSVAENKLVFNLGEASGNIWLAPAVR